MDGRNLGWAGSLTSRDNGTSECEDISHHSEYVADLTRCRGEWVGVGQRRRQETNTVSITSSRLPRAQSADTLQSLCRAAGDVILRQRRPLREPSFLDVSYLSRQLHNWWIYKRLERPPWLHLKQKLATEGAPSATGWMAQEGDFAKTFQLLPFKSLLPFIRSYLD